MADYKKEQHKDANISVSVRDFSRNLAYYVEIVQKQNVVLTKNGIPIALITKPNNKKQKIPLTELEFFTKFKEPESWKGKSSAQVADELREKAWKGKQ